MSVYYSDYLGLGKILDAQSPRSAEHGKPVHDETLFIIVHQAYELWFKQILHELNSIMNIFRAPQIEDTQMSTLVSRLERITEIQRLLIQQISVLETMTPMDFLEFRDYLIPASGFQSLQFRLVEMKLGLKDRHNFGNTPFYQYLNASDKKHALKAMEETSLFDLVEKWLERTPFLKSKDFNFWEEYKKAVLEMLKEDETSIKKNEILSEQHKALQMKLLEVTKKNFEAILHADQHEKLIEQGERRLSYEATKAALLINLYREMPALQLPFRILNTLVAIDENFTTWRYRHAQMVQRMIGMKIGTGGSSGHEYLRTTTEKHKIFVDLMNLSTLFIPSTKLPKLPETLKTSMGLRYN